MIPRGTTPTFTFTFTEEELDLTSAAHVYVTFSQGSRVLTKTGDALDIEQKSISVYLSQRETLMFNGKVEAQVNWTIAGDRIASNIVTIDMTKQLLNKVVD